MQAAADIETGDALSRASGGDRSAFGTLVRAHRSMVFSLAYHSCGNTAEAEELAQDVFVELFNHLSSIESAAHLKFWLRKVASRKCIDWARRERRRPKIALDDIPEPVAESRAADAFLSEALRKLVASLPELQRQIVLLRYQEEMEPAAIAEVVGIPVNTVKSNLHRALALLREKLARSGKVVSL